MHSSRSLLTIVNRPGMQRKLPSSDYSPVRSKGCRSDHKTFTEDLARGTVLGLPIVKIR